MSINFGYPCQFSRGSLSFWGFFSQCKHHPAGFRSTVNLWQGLSFNICLALGKLPFFGPSSGWKPGTTRGSQKHPSHPHCWWFNSYWMDGSGAPQCPTCHTLVSGSISTHSCGILSVVIFQTKIRVAHGLKQKTDGWTTELKHVKYKHVPPTNATIFKPPRYPRHPNSLK